MKFFDNKEDWNIFYNKLNNELLDSFRSMYDDESNILIFIYASDFALSAKTLTFLQKKNTFLISFCWDDLLYFSGNYKGQPIGVSKLSKFVDFNLTLSPAAIPIYNYHNNACFFWDALPIEITLNTYPSSTKSHEFYVLFIGSKYGWRERLIKKLQSKGINIICYGKGWPNGILPYNDMKIAVKIAPLVLGFSNVGYTKNITTIKGRDFEIPLFGGLYLTQYSKGLDKYYDIGKDILTYRNFNECYSKILMIKSNPSLGDSIRDSGYRKALSVCTWNSRFLFLSRLINQIIEKNNNIISTNLRQ